MWFHKSLCPSEYFRALSQFFAVHNFGASPPSVRFHSFCLNYHAPLWCLGFLRCAPNVVTPFCLSDFTVQPYSSCSASQPSPSCHSFSASFRPFPWSILPLLVPLSNFRVISTSFAVILLPLSRHFFVFFRAISWSNPSSPKHSLHSPNSRFQFSQFLIPISQSHVRHLHRPLCRRFLR